MTRSLLALLFMLAAAPAVAQTHPCDTVPSTIAVTSAPLSLLFCAKPSDDLVRAEATLDGATTAPFTDIDTIAMTGPSATGYVQYKAPLGLVPVGLHTVLVQVVNLDADGLEQFSDVSDPLSFTVLAPKPKPNKPKVTGVTK